MEQIKKFLEANKGRMIDFIDSNQRPISGNVYGELIAELVKNIPLSKDDVNLVLDKAHIELAIAILEVMWCGWLSSAKAKRGVYPSDYPDRFRQAISGAFEIGQRYVEEKP